MWSRRSGVQIPSPTPVFAKLKGRRQAPVLANVGPERHTRCRWETSRNGKGIAVLRELRIQNFKGWRDTGAIRMAPITLFFGANSSGKSSIGQFLMALKQTVEFSDRKAVLYLGNDNSAVQLDSFQEMVFGHDTENRISFNYRWSLPKALKLEDPLRQRKYSGDEVCFSAALGLKNNDPHALALDHLKYELMEKDETHLAVDMKRTSEKKLEYEINADHYRLTRNQGRVWSLGAPVQFYGFPDRVLAYYQNADFVKDLNLVHEDLFRSIHYLGPLRTRAKRLYSWTGTEPESVGYDGENTIAAILAARGRKINLGYRKPAKRLDAVIAVELKNMGLIEDFKVESISKQRREYEVKVRSRGSKDWVDLPDVGFGISQVLPVLVQCFYAPPGSIILMEQPEIHLHPSAQSALADVMIDVINSREDGKDRKIQLIIETHSEHFLRRLQRRIAEERISKEKLSAYFADITNAPAMLEELQIDTFGNILNWPKDFFGDELGDITKQAEATITRRIKKAKQPEAPG